MQDSKETPIHYVWNGMCVHCKQSFSMDQLRYNQDTQELLCDACYIDYCLAQQED